MKTSPVLLSFFAIIVGTILIVAITVLFQGPEAYRWSAWQLLETTAILLIAAVLTQVGRSNVC